MSRIARLVILYVILGVCVINAAAAIFTGKQPPEALYGVLGTIGAYVLLRDKTKKDDDDDDDGNNKRRKNKKQEKESRDE